MLIIILELISLDYRLSEILQKRTAIDRFATIQRIEFWRTLKKETMDIY